jgi:hypothetical protein
MTEQDTQVNNQVMLNILPPNLLGNTSNNTNIIQTDQVTELLPIKPPITIQSVDPMFSVVKDIVFNLILNMPGLRAKLDDILKAPNMAITEISKIFNEIQSKVPENEMNKLRNYISQDTSKTTLLTILQTSFIEIMADGKIDMNDANHFINLIYNIITLFNETSQNSTVTISGDAVMFFLYFIIKCVLILCLDGEEETTAVGLLDSSFKLVSIAVMPLTKMKCSCNLFKCFQKA